MPRSLAVAVFTSLIFARGLSADVVETSSSRLVTCSSQGGANIDGPYEMEDASTYGDFDGYVESFAWDDIGFHGGSSQASQQSHVSHGQYSVDMWVRTDAGGGTMGTDFAIGYAETVFEVRFTLTEATDFNVSGSYNAFGFINGAVSETEVRIDSVGGGTPSQVIAFTIDDCCPSVDIDGTLLPGDYVFKSRTLVIVDHSFMTSYTDSNAANVVTMTLNVPQSNPLGDMDCSGSVDADDVAPFIQTLLDPDAYDLAFPNCDKNMADMNQDALRDGDDIAAFVAAVLGA
ncbi:MAG: hypothetical protein H6818_05760 [Phycisphaerales bacterium]|nr:hypothetical protein [Phycisphaerales bacterium]MCB9862768.1 hypothetical protein [Phycisphaerales bacterium]